MLATVHTQPVARRVYSRDWRRVGKELYKILVDHLQTFETIGFIMKKGGCIAKLLIFRYLYREFPVRVLWRAWKPCCGILAGNQ
jgi:hypothetical protein